MWWNQILYWDPTMMEQGLITAIRHKNTRTPQGGQEYPNPLAVLLDKGKVQALVNDWTR